ncbi:MAG TPA: hypothetical protein VHP58_06430 [Alphaproteobacteria bacterium]|nr:hypothetical protein [Alphaproteobacteria bacterium]
MADTLATLIKLAAQKVEKVQQELATVQRQLDEVTFTQNRWRNDVARADAMAMESVQKNESEGLHQAAMFSRRADNELMVLAKIETLLREKIDEIMQRLNAHFAEQKRYEILQEQKQLAEHKKLAKKHQAELDEASSRKRPG